MACSSQLCLGCPPATQWLLLLLALPLECQEAWVVLDSLLVKWSVVDGDSDSC